MKIENEDTLDRFIICKKCYTLHQEIPLRNGTKGCCTVCNSVIYRHDTQLLSKGLALSIAGFILFSIANLFPLVKIELLGHHQFITISKTFLSLFEHGFYIVGLLCLFLIFLFPLVIFGVNILLFTLLSIRRGPQLSKSLLILLSKVMPWSMSDIFLVSILVALIKLIGYAEIEMGIAFWSLMGFVMIDIFISKGIPISELWNIRATAFAQRDAT